MHLFNLMKEEAHLLSHVNNMEALLFIFIGIPLIIGVGALAIWSIYAAVVALAVILNYFKFLAGRL